MKKETLNKANRILEEIQDLQITITNLELSNEIRFSQIRNKTETYHREHLKINENLDKEMVFELAISRATEEFKQRIISIHKAKLEGLENLFKDL